MYVRLNLIHTQKHYVAMLFNIIFIALQLLSWMSVMPESFK